MIAAKVEQIIEFDSKADAKEFINFVTASDLQFKVLDEDEIALKKYRIRIVKSYNKNEMLITESGLQNK